MQKKYSSLGVSVPIEVPSTVEEFNNLYWANTPAEKRTGNPCLEAAVDNVAYRSCLAEFRRVFLHGKDEIKDGDRIASPAIKGVEQLTGIDRDVKTIQLKSRDKDGNLETREDWDISESKYFGKVLAATGKKAEDFQALAEEVAATISFDPSRSEPSESGPKKLAKTYVETATKIIEANGFQTAVNKIAGVLGRTIQSTGDKERDIALLGWFIKDWKDYESKRLNETLMS